MSAISLRYSRWRPFEITDVPVLVNFVFLQEGKNVAYLKKGKVCEPAIMAVVMVMVNMAKVVSIRYPINCIPRRGAAGWESYWRCCIAKTWEGIAISWNTIHVHAANMPNQYHWL